MVTSILKRLKRYVDYTSGLERPVNTGTRGGALWTR